MKLICMAGDCGSGKTTAIDIMAQNLPNSVIVRGDLYLKDALLNSTKEFEDIYNVPLDRKQPFRSFMSVSVSDSTAINIKNYIRMFNAFIPFIENEIEKAIKEYKNKDKDFILVEYVALPSYKTWKKADYRAMITSENELRINKLKERMISKYDKNEEKFTLLSETALTLFTERADNVDFIIKNKYNENFRNDLIECCQKIVM